MFYISPEFPFLDICWDDSRNRRVFCKIQELVSIKKSFHCRCWLKWQVPYSCTKVWYCLKIIYNQILSSFDTFLHKFNFTIAKNLHYVVSIKFKIISIVKPALTNKLTAIIAKRTEFLEKIYLLNSVGTTCLRLILISWIEIRGVLWTWIRFTVSYI